jgi:ech hydrogenase subunit D
MSEPQEILPIGKNDLVGTVAQLFAEGYRLVQIGCSTLPGGYEINYSFDKDYRFKNLRIMAVPGEEVPSISVIYPNAFLYENEIHDLFGVPVKNIAIDYRGTLYRTAIPTPFSTENLKFSEPPKPKPEVSAQPKAAPPAPPKSEAPAQPKAEAPGQQKVEAPVQPPLLPKESPKEQAQIPEAQKE